MTQKYNFQRLNIPPYSGRGHERKAEIAVDCLILERCKFLGLCSFSTMLVTCFPQRHPITHSLQGSWIPSIPVADYSLGHADDEVNVLVHCIITLIMLSFILNLLYSCEIFELMLQKRYDWGKILSLEEMSHTSLLSAIPNRGDTHCCNLVPECLLQNLYSTHTPAHFSIVVYTSPASCSISLSSPYHHSFSWVATRI